MVTAVPWLLHLFNVPVLRTQCVSAVDWQAYGHAYAGLRHVYAGLRHVYAGLRHVYAGLRHAYAGLRHVYAGLRHVTAWTGMR
jgi:hypothetical protein